MEEEMNLSLFQYPQLSAEDQGIHANALLGLLFEKEILYQPSYAQLVGDTYAAYWLSWFVSHCRYGESIELNDDDMSHQFGFSMARWHNIRRLLKKLGYLKSSRKSGVVSYSLDEKTFSDAHGEISNNAPLIPVDRITAAAMLDKGMNMTDVLIFSTIKFHMSIRDLQEQNSLDASGNFSTWQDHDSEQKNNLSGYSEIEQYNSIKKLSIIELLQVVLIKELNMLRYRINYKAYGELTYAYVHKYV